MTNIPPLYRIPEIPIKNYLDLVSPLYDIMEGRHLSNSETDKFTQEGWMLFHDISKEEWEHEQKIIQMRRAFTMAWGAFHQGIIGSFEGWVNYPKGHPTGCDCGNKDDTCTVEAKNAVNTMNSGSKESVMKKLKIQKALGKRAVLVQINSKMPKTVKDGIETISGRDFYKELSGRENFMDDLLSTTNESFRRYKTFDALKAALENC